MKRILVVVFWMLSAALACSAQSTFYFPHIANGVLALDNVWKTTIYLANTGGFTASGTITFRKDGENVNLAGPVFTDIVFTDQRMPKMSGEAFAIANERVRDLGRDIAKVVTGWRKKA